jgi:DNA-directed RNA polymerase subunit RPC12/RpoP
MSILESTRKMTTNEKMCYDMGYAQGKQDTVPVVRGEWRQGKEFSTYPRVPFISTAYYCSNCEGEAYWDTDYGQQLFAFCPNCGAKMGAQP